MAGAVESFHGIVGRSPVMRELFADIERFAPVDVPVLIRGESGTGKELVARAVQRLSRRRERPFETLNCADLTRELLRSELFGHERGAFTGAVSRSMGLVSRLDGGTLFMDEIGELAPDAQAMLLRFLQAGEGRAVGASRSVTTDVRIIAATHRDLEAGVEQGTFREDVYYRLWCAVLEVPPLRNRREDIEILIDHFRKEANLRPGSGLDIAGFTDEALTVLARDEWPGNVRELEAVVRRAMVRRRHGWVNATDIVFPKLRRKGVRGHRAGEWRSPHVGAGADAPACRSPWRGAPARCREHLRRLARAGPPSAPWTRAIGHSGAHRPRPWHALRSALPRRVMAKRDRRAGTACQ